MKKNAVEGMGNLSAYQVSKYESRAQKLLDKCTGVDTGPVILRTTGEEVWIIPGSATSHTADALEKLLGGEQEFRGQYSVNVTSSTGEDVVPISAIAKTKEFGGGSGVAGGSDLTRVVEANQCIACAKLQYGDDYVNFVCLDKGESVENLLQEKEQLDDNWQNVINSIGEKLAGSLQPGYWHWHDDFVKSIQSTYGKLHDKLAGTFDRYNPADIWYTTGSCSSLPDTKNINQLSDLTEKLNVAFEEKSIIGISLKKTSNPELVSYDAKKRDVKFDLDKVDVCSRNKGTLYFNIPFTLNGVSHLCQIRKDGFGYRATVKAVTGQEHYDGSVGKGIIQHCLTKIYDRELDIFEPRFYLEKENRQLAEHILNHLAGDIENTEELLKGIHPFQLSRDPETFRSGSFNPQENAIADSLDAIVYVLQNSGEEKQKEFLGRLLRYAWSIHTESCNFLKVDSKKSKEN